MIVNTPAGTQERLEIDEGGSYFEPDRIVWNEWLDGPLPEWALDQLGGLVRVMVPAEPGEGEDEEESPTEVATLEFDAQLQTASLAALLSLARESTWAAIKAERDRRLLVGGFKVSIGGADKWFHSDLVSRSQQLALDSIATKMKALGAADATLVTPVPWKTMDGTTVLMSVGLALQLLPAAATREAANFATAETHKAAMEASDEPAEYEFDADWPQTFEETLEGPAE